VSKVYEPIGFYANCDDAYCPSCFEEAFGVNGERWPGFESWDEPLPIFSDTEADTPTHCAACEELIPHALTTDGYAYVDEAYREVADGVGGRRCIVRAWVLEYSEDEDALGAVESWPEADEYTPVLS